MQVAVLDASTAATASQRLHQFSSLTWILLFPLQLFMRARKWPDMRWQAYAASALMEWRHEAKDT